MNIVLLLHFYQPYYQHKDMLFRIIGESYTPLVNILSNAPKSKKITVNISGSLVRLFHENRCNELLKIFSNLYSTGRIELTRSSMYHSLLPLLPKSEIMRQINLNDEIFEEYFKGYAKNTFGFFPPELAVNHTLLEVLKDIDIKWLIAPQVSYNDLSDSKQFANDTIYIDKKTNINIFFRSKLLSSLVLSATIHSVDDLLREVRDIDDIANKYFFLVMDAETFGHHRVGHERFLSELLHDKRINIVTPSDLLSNKLALKKEYVKIRPSSWSNSEQDFWLDKERTTYTESNSFILWNDPNNPIHKLQWQLTRLALKCVNMAKNKKSAAWEKARDLLDKALASDQYWWASSKPWWSLEMIELGAYSLKEVILKLPDSSHVHKKADVLYRKILDRAFYWQRSGYIKAQHSKSSDTYLKIPFKDRTSSEWFNQVILEFEHEMKLAEAKQDYEKAIKWRDAVIKISLGADIYDVIHVVDELWLGRNVKWAEPQVKPFLEHTWEEFSPFAKKHFLECSSEKEFDAWKRRRQKDKKE